MDNEIKRIKHSKFKNTGLLFELLVRQTTSDVLNERDESLAIKLVKRYFSKDKPLYRELTLYKTLMETKFSSEDRAKELIDETLNARKKLNNSSLKKEKYNLIKEISVNFNIDEFFKNKLINYKELASVYKLFESVLTTEGELLPQEKIQCRQTLIERISNKPVASSEINDSMFDEYRKQSDDLKKLAYSLMIEKFNKKYQSLDDRQKTLLREFIYNSTDISTFRSFINNQIKEIKIELSGNASKIEDDGTRIKVEGMIKHIDELKHDKGSIKDEDLIQLMKYFELAKEVKRATSKETVNG